VYEPRYPRTRHRRWGYIARKALEMAAAATLQYLIMGQFMLPVLQSPSRPRNDSAAAAAGAIVFDMMKLALPSLCVWLLGFYGLFHCYMNLLAEVLRFGDRAFFADWWNSTTLDTFWRRWNIPVHEWCLRHVYLDLQTFIGVNKHTAIFATFFFSAVIHELLFSVAFKTLRPWFFFGMLAQIPLIAFSRGCRNKRRGNYLVWWSLFSGQPLLEVRVGRGGPGGRGGVGGFGAVRRGGDNRVRCAAATAHLSRCKSYAAAVLSGVFCTPCVILLCE